MKLMYYWKGEADLWKLNLRRRLHEILYTLPAQLIAKDEEERKFFINVMHIAAATKDVSAGSEDPKWILAPASFIPPYSDRRRS